jgi:CubicO group peptidase (beta-lactamase class C family)
VLAAAGYDAAGGWLEVQWQVERRSNCRRCRSSATRRRQASTPGRAWPSSPNCSGADGAFLTGDDGLWVDPLTLRDGDVFLQRHALPAPDGAAAGGRHSLASTTR